ncbi:hypothetical protein U1Q18_012814 [Sarracenia purpurea var. burkii]
MASSMVLLEMCEVLLVFLTARVTLCADIFWPWSYSPFATAGLVLADSADIRVAFVVFFGLSTPLRITILIYCGWFCILLQDLADFLLN